MNRFLATVYSFILYFMKICETAHEFIIQIDLFYAEVLQWKVPDHAELVRIKVQALHFYLTTKRAFELKTLTLKNYKKNKRGVAELEHSILALGCLSRELYYANTFLDYLLALGQADKLGLLNGWETVHDNL